jgi:hypothetical protein
MSYRDKLIPIQTQTGTGYRSKLVPIKSERDTRIAQGIPVSSQKRFERTGEAAPTLGGSILRGVIKAPLKVGLSIPAGVRGGKGVTVRSDYLGKTSDIAKTVEENSEMLANKVKSGEITPGRAVLGSLGNSALQVADVASVVPVSGFVKSVGVNTAKSVAARTAGQIATNTLKNVGKSALRGAGTSALYDVGAQAASGEKYNPGQTLGAAALGAAFDVGLSQGVPAVVSRFAPKPKGALPRAVQKNITNTERELFNIENNYQKLRKAAAYSKDGNQATRSRIAQTGILAEAVDNTGTIRTDKAIERYRAQTIDGAESVVRKNLERLGETIDLDTIEKQLTKEIYASGLEGNDLRNALNNVKKEISGYRLRAVDGKIPLTLVHDAKIATTKNINFQTPPETQTYRKAVASGLKKTVEDSSSFNVKEVNESLKPYLKDIEYLRNLDGRKVRGGKLGKYSARIAGNIAGGLVGSTGGFAGSAAGTIIGGEVADRLQGRALSRTFGGETGITLPKSPILKKAVETGNSPRLQLPAPIPGAPRTQIGSGRPINLPKRTQSRIDSLTNQNITSPNINPANIGISPTVPRINERINPQSGKVNTKALAVGGGLAAATVPFFGNKLLEKVEGQEIEPVTETNDPTQVTPPIEKVAPTKTVPPAVPEQYVAQFKKAADRYNVPYNILNGVIKHESGWNPRAFNPGDSDTGLGQHTPIFIETYKKRFEELYNHDYDPYRPYDNIHMTALGLADLYKRTGNWNDAVIAYNNGVEGMLKMKKANLKSDYLRKVKAAM